MTEVRNGPYFYRARIETCVYGRGRRYRWVGERRIGMGHARDVRRGWWTADKAKAEKRAKTWLESNLPPEISSEYVSL